MIVFRLGFDYLLWSETLAGRVKIKNRTLKIIKILDILSRFMSLGRYSFEWIKHTQKRESSLSTVFYLLGFVKNYLNRANLRINKDW